MVTLSSPGYFPALQCALDWYCQASNAQFNTTKTELLLVNTPLPPLPSPLPVTPTPPGHHICYLGAYLSNNLDLTLLADDLIIQVLSHTTCTIQAASTIKGCALIIHTFSLPKL
ncbi:hypothetical protein IWQ61_010383, partial [Dispira simplex]